MQKTIVGLLVGCMGILLIAILLIGLLGGGLSKQVKARAQAELDNLAGATTQLAEARKEIEQALAREPTLFESEQVDRPWKIRLDAADEKMQEASSSSEKLSELLEKNDGDDTQRVEDTIQKIQAARLEASNDVEQMRALARKLQEFKKQLADRLPQLKDNHDAIQSYNLSKLKQVVEKAAIDWPEKESNLKRRLAVYTSGIMNASVLWNRSQAARERAANGQANGADIVALMNVAGQFSELLTSLKAAEEELPKLIDQLYWVWDKVLTDMEIQEGADVAFRQQFQINRYPVVMLAEGKEDEAEEIKVESADPQWRTVSKQTYESMKTKLGMTVQHKPAGKFDHEATSLVQPPGYAYISPIEQKRNHYGYWRHHQSGYYYWYFYRPYYPMRSRLFGHSYTPVTSRMYTDYDLHRQSGRTYYGRDNSGRQLYGSTGSATKQNFSKSRYVSTNGFSNTQYVRSGGNYKGTRYSSTRSSSGSSRSASYRSSSYSRSRGSFSFGGK